MSNLSLGLILALSLVLVQCSDSAATFTVNTSLSSTAAAVHSRDCDRMTCTGSPLNLYVRLYRAYVSTSKDCSSPILVTDHGSTGQLVNLGADSLISASPAAGTYQCLILDMSDLLTFTPDSTAVAAFPGVCVSGTSSTFDIYRTDSGDDGLWKNISGDAIVATGSGTTSGENRVVIWGSTDIPVLQAGAAAPHINQTLTLSAPLTVPGQMTFYADFSNGITGDGGQCKIEGGTGMGFR